MFLMTLKIDYYHIYKRSKENFLLKHVLGFFSAFYRLAYKLRLKLYEIGFYKGVSFPVKVISIGNITTGGTGKTPTTIELAKHLINKGFKVAILSRGYRKQNVNENVLVSDGVDILADYEVSGDEPYLIAKNLRKAIVLSGANRVKSAYSAIRLNAQVILLDDGYQHLRINRNENILLLDSSKPFDNGYLLPRGELREDLECIKRATAIIFTNSKDFQANESHINIVKNINSSAPILFMNYKIKAIRGINIKKNITVEEGKKNKYISFSGIGNPENFTNSLKESGLEVIQSVGFPDHHDYEYADIRKVIDIAIKNNVQDIITTEKDAIKLEELCMSAPVTFWYTEIEVRWKDSSSLEILTKSC